MNYSDGNYYLREFKNGKKSGKGKICYSNENNYEGEWLNDYSIGKGMFYYSDGNYIGKFKKEL